jgi:hypothetical protein
MNQRIKLIVDVGDDFPAQHLTVDATDRIVIVIDEFGVTARSDGEKFDTISNVETQQEPINFDNQLTLFDSKPWRI